MTDTVDAEVVVSPFAPLGMATLGTVRLALDGWCRACSASWTACARVCEFVFGETVCASVSKCEPDLYVCVQYFWLHSALAVLIRIIVINDPYNARTFIFCIILQFLYGPYKIQVAPTANEAAR